MRKRINVIMACITCLTMVSSLTACSGGTQTSGTVSSDEQTAPVSLQDAGASDGKTSYVNIDRAKEFVTIATGPTSGIYYPIGGAFATVLGNAGYKTSAQATGARLKIST